MNECRRTRLQARLGRMVGFSVAAFLLLGVGDVQAHPISVVVETAFVERDRITIDVECFAEDLYFYHDLEPNDANEATADSLRQAAVAHGPLLLERLPVYDAGGRRIEGGRVVSVTGNEFTEDIPLGELMGYNVIYRLELPLGQPPEYLSFSQRLVDSDAGFPALVDFRVKQAGDDDELTATLKPGNVRTVQLDWSRSDSGDGSERDAWLEKQRDDAFGATALNSVRSFLYIEPREVRHELLIPFPLLESYFTVDRADPDFLTHEEQEAAKPKVADYFRDRNPITIDGVKREPTVGRIEFFTLDDRNLTRTQTRRTVSAVNARVGLILSYPLDVPAQDLELQWNAFNRQAWRVDAFVFAGGEILRPKLSMATRDDTFVWTRPPMSVPEPVPVAHVEPPPSVSLPWLSLVVAGAGAIAVAVLRRRPAAATGFGVTALVLAAGVWGQAQLTIQMPGRAATVSPGEAEAIVRTLHSNLYRAADAATDEEAVEALAAAADGELMRTLVLQLIENMRADDPDAGVLAVRDVQIESARRAGKPRDDGGFDYEVIWDVTARMEHWGHVHDRRYRYDALLKIAPRHGRWLITGMELRDARLIEDSSMPPEML